MSSHERAERVDEEFADPMDPSSLSRFVEGPGRDIEFINTVVRESGVNDEELSGIDQDWTALQGVVQEDSAAYVDGTRTYLNQIGEVALLTHDQEISLGMRKDAGLRAEEELGRGDIGDKQREQLEQTRLDGLKAQKHMVRANLRLVVSNAKKYQIPQMTRDDHIQAGNIGLMRAVQKYDHKKGFRFSTYASWWIRQSILRQIISDGRTIRLPANLHQAIGKGMKAVDEFIQTNGREPRTGELPGLFLDSGMDSTHIKNAVYAYESGMTRSLSSLDYAIDESRTLGELIPDPHENPIDLTIDRVDLRSLLDEAEKLLNERSYQILVLRFGLDGGNQMTLQEVGDRFMLTRERVRQIESNSLKKLKIKLGRKYSGLLDGQLFSALRELPVTNDVYVRKERVDSTVSSTLYERAALILSEDGLEIDASDRRLLAMVSEADKETFKQVCDKVSDEFGIPRGDVVMRLLDIIIRIEKV